MRVARRLIRVPTATPYTPARGSPKPGILATMSFPCAELLVGVCLIGGIFVSGALPVSIAMGAMFSFVIGSALYRGLNISCGCLSSSSIEQIGYTTLIRACVIMLLSIAAYISVLTLRPQSGPSKSSIPTQSLP